VVVEIAERTPELLVCDGRRLGQILHRLVQNAVAHTHRGEIRIFARWTAGRLTVGVRDTGTGIAAEHQARIFMAFYQVDPGTGPAHGVGLGLAYAQLLANAMGGSIQVNSEPGRGAEFTVDIPAPMVELDGEASGAGGGAAP
jgi:signal transduction histidine kinase